MNGLLKSALFLVAAMNRGGSKKPLERKKSIQAMKKSRSTYYHILLILCKHQEFFICFLLLIYVYVSGSYRFLFLH